MLEFDRLRRLQAITLKCELKRLMSFLSYKANSLLYREEEKREDYKFPSRQTHYITSHLQNPPLLRNFVL